MDCEVELRDTYLGELDAQRFAGSPSTVVGLDNLYAAQITVKDCSLQQGGIAFIWHSISPLLHPSNTAAETSFAVCLSIQTAY